MEFEFKLGTSSIRLIAKTGANRVMSTDEVEAFLLVHGEQLHNTVSKAAREFIIDKLKGGGPRVRPSPEFEVKRG